MAGAAREIIDLLIIKEVIYYKYAKFTSHPPKVIKIVVRVVNVDIINNIPHTVIYYRVVMLVKYIEPCSSKSITI